MTKPDTPLLIKRYASRRLYNTEASDYVTLEGISGFIRDGREVQIVDKKTGEDLTRQYLVQIIADHEARGENVLPLNVLTDLVRSYSTPGGNSVVPEFLSMSFDMLRSGQAKAMENLGTIPNPLASMPGFQAMRTQQQAFMKALATGWNTAAKPEADDTPDSSELDEIKAQLAELQSKLSKL